MKKVISKKKVVKKVTGKRKLGKRKQAGKYPLLEKEMTTNETEYEIREGVPLPWGRIRRGEIEVPFQFMNVGDSFSFIQKAKGAGRVYSASISYCKQEVNFHKKFVVRKIKEEFDRGVLIYTYGCWRLIDLSEEEIAEKKERYGINSFS